MPLALFKPRFWPTWAGLGLLFLLVRLPYPWQIALGKGVGRIMFLAMPRRRRIARVNLALCFPERSEEERERLLKAHFASLGIAPFEMAMGWWAKEGRLEGLAQIEGLAHLKEALAKGKGAILLSGHFTTVEIGGRLLARHLPFCALYREAKNPAFEYILKRGREKRIERAIPRRDMRGLLRCLKANLPVWYAPDQDYGRENSVFVPFFGIPAATITATARLARISGAPVLPFFQERLPQGGYRLTLAPPLEGFPSGHDEKDARRINAIVEAAIRRAPDQYLWIHRRFKTRPRGMPSVY